MAELHLQMSEGEILQDYKYATKKFEQVRILAELNCVSNREMATWLRDHGETVDKRYFREQPVRKPKPKEEEEHMEEKTVTEVTEAPHRADIDTVVTPAVITVPTPDDPVSHPAHYTDGNIEVIDYIEDKRLGFCLGNVVKYVSRAGKKDPAKKLEDLKKAAWYLDRYIKTEERRNETQG